MRPQVVTLCVFLGLVASGWVGQVHAESVVEGVDVAATPEILFAGTDYSDLIDELRARVTADSYESKRVQEGLDKSSPQALEFRTLANKIERDLSREQNKATSLFRVYQQQFLDRDLTLNGTVTNATAWIKKADAKIIWNTKRVLNLTKWVHLAPGKIAVKKEVIKQLALKITQGQKIRDEANTRFRIREHNAKEVITGIMHVLGQLGGVINTTTRYNKDLKSTLDKKHSPKFKSVAESVNLKAAQLSHSDDINSIRKQLLLLKKQFHLHLVSLTTTEAKWTRIWNAKKAILTAHKAAATTRLHFLIASIPHAKAEMAKLVKETASLHAQRPFKVDALMRAKTAIHHLEGEHGPLVKQYIKHQQKRAAQIADVQKLLVIVHKHYDGNHLAK